MSAPRKFIVSTTINPPTEAIRRFDALADWTLIVTGDRRTPVDYRLDNGIYVAPEEQERLAPELSGLIGWNTIERRNLGFVLALDMGADIVASVDDDNLLYDGWGDNLMVGRTVDMPVFEAPNGCFDPIGATEHRHLWHRGYPLQLISSRDYSKVATAQVHVDVQADFWDGDPDIDAVCRMEHAPCVKFDAASFPFASSAVSPFNSQNTFLTREALKHYFVLPGVGRMDDIWAAYHMQHLGFKVAYGRATVRQDRNEHDLTRDLVGEFAGYERGAELVAAMNEGTYDATDFWPERAVTAYDAYLRRVGSTDNSHRVGSTDNSYRVGSADNSH